MIREFFPIEYIQLDKELRSGHHPKLEAILARISANDIDMKLAHIAFCCEVMLDGDYELKDRIKLCEILKNKLIRLRGQEKYKSIVIIDS